jgi:hypothetical protein
MSTKAIEQELLKLQARVNHLEARVASLPEQGWRAAFGMLKGSKFAREAARLGAEYRTRQNKQK